MRFAIRPSTDRHLSILIAWSGSLSLPRSTSTVVYVLVVRVVHRFCLWGPKRPHRETTVRSADSSEVKEGPREDRLTATLSETRAAPRGLQRLSTAAPIPPCVSTSSGTRRARTTPWVGEGEGGDGGSSGSFRESVGTFFFSFPSARLHRPRTSSRVGIFGGRWPRPVLGRARCVQG